MGNTRLLKIGIVGTVVSAICCFTPVLVIGLSAVGAAGLVVWLDRVLLPALVFFAVLTVYALLRRRRGT